MSDIGLTHIALPVKEVDRSIKFYATYANMEVIHRRKDPQTDVTVVWLSDGTRPFVIVLIEVASVQTVLAPFAHLGVGCASREGMDELCNLARQEKCLIQGPMDSGYPIGYWAFLEDPDGHTLELSFGQDVRLAVERAHQ